MASSIVPSSFIGIVLAAIVVLGFLMVLSNEAYFRKIGKVLRFIGIAILDQIIGLAFIVLAFIIYTIVTSVKDSVHLTQEQTIYLLTGIAVVGTIGEVVRRILKKILQNIEIIEKEEVKKE